MNIQSISILIPTHGCVNSCKFCVSRMHENNYENKINFFQIEKRIKWAVNNGVNTCVLTGTGEALQNTKFLNNLIDIFKELGHPFPNVELQTSGVLLMQNNNVQILHDLGVNTISLSVSNLFDDNQNMDIIGVLPKMQFKLKEITSFIKEQGFNLRMSLNLTDSYDYIKPETIFNCLKSLKTDQVTFRKLYHIDDEECEQSIWVKNHACKEQTINDIHKYIIANGKPLYRLPFGSIAFSINGISAVIDDNCMNKDEYDKLKYVILRENGKLYSQWDDEGSLIF